jgi:hypothetical protein
MAEVIKVNSRKAIVSLTREDISKYDLARWLRTNSKGAGQYAFTNMQPFERVAAQLYIAENPSSQVKIAENVIFYPLDGNVDVFLQVTDDFSKGYYNTHPTKLVFNKGKSFAIEENFKKAAEEEAEESDDSDDDDIDTSEDDPKKEEVGEEEFLTEVNNFLEEIKDMPPEEMVKTISPEELQSIKEMLHITDEEPTGGVLKTIDLNDATEPGPEIIKIDLLKDNPEELDKFVKNHFQEDADEFGSDKIKDIMKNVLR